jgi:hypothetical protein
VTNLFHDLWYALRRLRKSPGFTASAITMLAVGIGANTAIFSLLNTVMLRELPVREPDSDSTLRSVDCHGQAPYSMLHFFMYVNARYHSAARYRQSAESAVAPTPLASIPIFHTYKNHRGAPRTSEFRFSQFDLPDWRTA